MMTNQLIKKTTRKLYVYICNVSIRENPVCLRETECIMTIMSVSTR